MPAERFGASAYAALGQGYEQPVADLIDPL